MSLSRGDTGLEAGLRRESDLRLWGVEVWELRPEAKPPPPPQPCSLWPSPGLCPALCIAAVALPTMVCGDGEGLSSLCLVLGDAAGEVLPRKTGS